jgi:D-alanine-D-alanine ligase
MKIRVGVLVGGASSEREISLASGKMIADHLPRDRYDVVVLDTLALMVHNPRLSPEMRARARALLTGAASSPPAGGSDATLPESFREEIRSAAAQAQPATQALSPTTGGPGIDVAFLALHGPFGEDGTIQGFLDLVGIPYVGSGTLASAVAMDKVVAKKLLAAAGVPTPRGILLSRHDFREDPQGATARAESLLPAVVKPSRQGSSIGMTLVSAKEALGPALETAFSFDSRVLVEERLVGAELTVGIIGNRDLTALPVVEIVSKKSFFDYQAKYDPSFSEEICPARISVPETKAAQGRALESHRALECRGFSRVDMILTPEGPVVLEVNTIPGMTINSLLPKAAKVAGIPFSELLHRLVQLALEPEE